MTARSLARFAAAAILTLSAAPPAAADDFLDTLDAARAAYEAGDVNTAKAEIDFAAQLLAQMKAEGLQAFLPEPMEGWTFSEGDSAGAMAFGGGAFASGVYERDGETVEIQLIAGNQFVTSMGAMFSNPALMGASGAQVKRVAGQRVAISQDDEITGMIGEVFMQIGGSADVDAKIGYIEIMDLGTMAEERF